MTADDLLLAWLNGDDLALNRFKDHCLEAGLGSYNRSSDGSSIDQEETAF